MQNIGGTLVDPDTNKIVPSKTADEAKDEYLKSLGKPIPGELTSLDKPAIPDYAADGPGQDIIMECTKKMQRIHDKKVQEVTLKCDGILSKMKDLRNQIDDLEQSPMTKGELAREAKKAFNKMKEEVRRRLITEHLESCQNRRSLPFSEPAMSVLLEGRDYLLSYFIFSEKDIDKAIQALPDIGISKEEREAKIKSLEKQIAKLAETIADEFDALVK